MKNRKLFTLIIHGTEAPLYTKKYIPLRISRIRIKYSAVDNKFLYMKAYRRGYGGAVVTHSPPTSEVCCSNLEPYVGKMVVPCRWPAVYSLPIKLPIVI